MTLLKTLLEKHLKNQLVSGSIVLLLGTSVASFGNYLYHLLMGRMLGPTDYGVLASLISLTYLIGIPLGTLNVVVVRYVSAWRGKKRLGEIAYFYSWLSKKLVVFGIAGFFLLLTASPFLASFLHLETMVPLLIVIISNMMGIYQTVNSAILQGFLRFGLMAALGIIQVVLKLGLAVFLVFIGWRVLGAVVALLVSALIAYWLTTFWVVGLLKKPKKESNIVSCWGMKRYAIPVFFSTLAFTSLYTTDVVLARHFLSPQEAGFYASLATLGKIIFFASSPIVTAMFPIVSEHHANRKDYLYFFHLSFGLVFLVCLGISGIYFLFPRLMVRLLFGSQYLAAAPHLFLFALFLSFYSLSSLVVNFHLSVRKVGVVVLPTAAAVIQIFLISLFHHSLAQIIWVSIGVLGLLFVSLLVYYFLSYGKTKKAFTFSYRSCL